MEHSATSPFHQQVTRQLTYNHRKNLFCRPEVSSFGFAPSTVAFLQKQVLHKHDPELEEQLLQEVVPQVLSAFYQVNQFYHFTETDIAALKAIYKVLLKEVSKDDMSQQQLKEVAQRHYRRLQNWLKATNPFGLNIYTNNQPYIQQEVVCAEYSA